MKKLCFFSVLTFFLMTTQSFAGGNEDYKASRDLVANMPGYLNLPYQYFVYLDKAAQKGHAEALEELKRYARGINKPENKNIFWGEDLEVHKKIMKIFFKYGLKVLEVN
ncbi:MAG: hypothetical protein Q8L85_06830 [Alphaproteobacteria bacterium]|nr:hypothetical protein [Alphaproteobacteria bacterium]